MIQKEQTFQEVLIPYIEKLLKGLKTGIDYASQEIPIVLEQYVIYEAFMAWLFILIGIIIFVGWIKVYLKQRKKSWFRYTKDKGFYKKGDTTEAAGIFSILGWVIFTITLIVSFLGNISTAIQATFFSKLFLLKEFMEYI